MIEIAKSKYPELDVVQGQSGKRQLLYVNYGQGASKANPIWLLVGGTENAAFNIKGEVKTVSTKDTGLWATGALTGKSAELTCSCVYQENNTAQAVVEQFMLDDNISNEKKALEFALVDLDTLQYLRIVCIPSGWNRTGNSGDMVKKDLTATVIGKPEQADNWTEPIINTVNPTIANFDKDSAADVEFEVTLGDVGTITSVKNGTYTLQGNADFTYSDGTLTIKKEYLTTLDNGTAELTIVPSVGNTMPVTINISGGEE